jgi:hypothetical protein
MKTIAITMLLLTLLYSIACKKSSSNNNTATVDCTGVTAKFSTDALPVITSQCATNSGCHAAGASNSGGALTNYNEINARKSNIKTTILNGSMPKGSSLSAAQKQSIICWIDNGALNN